MAPPLTRRPAAAGASRGYFLLDLDRDRAQAEWTYVDSPEMPASGFSAGGAWMTRAGNNHLEPAASLSAPGEDRAPAPWAWDCLGHVRLRRRCARGRRRRVRKLCL